ncbi:class I SAM-dependent methyltransferase [Neolewinella maritima]|nr:class I SAM-dependent methyltransferase [Neolewinella maritima]
MVAKRTRGIEGNTSAYSTVFKRGFDAAAGKYRVINYATKFLLFRSTGESIALDREVFWQNISGYHEHLPIDLQRDDITKRTKWLAERINAFNPQSVLELGCGSGRNLYFIQQENPDCALFGVEINADAIRTAEEKLGSTFRLLSNSIYALEDIASNSIDVVFTSGALMHIASDKLAYIKGHIERIAKKAILHYELHGPEHIFDFHRYPRDYRQMYHEVPDAHYEVFDETDFRNAGTESFHHALLVVER